MTADRLRLRLAELVQDSADEHGVVEPNAELLGSALGAVVDFTDALNRDADAAQFGAGIVARAFSTEIRGRIADRLGVE